MIKMVQSEASLHPHREILDELHIILECLHEAYGMEQGMLVSGYNIRRTMIYPFLRMIEECCHSVRAETIHRILWRVYLAHGEKQVFVEHAEAILKPCQNNAEFIQPAQEMKLADDRERYD